MYNHFYTEQRMRSFRQRKHISNENRLQAVLCAVVFTVAIIVLGQFVVAQRDLTQAQVDYVKISEVR